MGIASSRLAPMNAIVEAYYFDQYDPSSFVKTCREVLSTAPSGVVMFSSRVYLLGDYFLAHPDSGLIHCHLSVRDNYVHMEILTRYNIDNY